MFKLKKINTHAFTLVELLATIVILGIIMLIAVPAFNSYTSSAKKKVFFTSVSNIVNSIKPESLIDGTEFCMYNYSKDSQNKIPEINSMYVLLHRENNNLIYSVYAKSKEDTIDINIYDFNTLNMGNSEEWVYRGKKMGSYSQYILKLLQPNNSEQDNSGSNLNNLNNLMNFKVCDLKG